jgi:hypothetical protein
MRIEPIGELIDGEVRTLPRFDRHGTTVAGPIVLTR